LSVRGTAVLPSSRQQKDNLCGPYWVARVLNDAGFNEWDGEPLDQDVVALRAGTALPEPVGEPSVPRGAASMAHYRFELPYTAAEESGTSPAGLVRAIEQASGGELRAVPIRGRWSAERVERLVADAPGLGARLIANVRTGKLWGSRARPEQVLAELNGEAATGPDPDWDVGHYIELAMLIRGPRGSLVAVRDSYPSLGWEGNHLQPPRAVAEALLRGDGREGGVLVVVHHRGVGDVAALVRQLGLEIGVWNNGNRESGHGDS
jgi:hypothetical protein